MRITVEPNKEDGYYTVRVVVDVDLRNNHYGVPLMLSRVTRESEPDLFRMIDSPPAGVEVLDGVDGGWEITEHYSSDASKMIRRAITREEPSKIYIPETGVEFKKDSWNYPVQIGGFVILEVRENPRMPIPKIGGVDVVRFMILDGSQHLFLFRIEIKGEGVITWEKHISAFIGNTPLDHWVYNPGMWIQKKVLQGNDVSLISEEEPYYETMYKEWRAKNGI